VVARFFAAFFTFKGLGGAAVLLLCRAELFQALPDKVVIGSFHELSMDHTWR